MFRFFCFALVALFQLNPFSCGADWPTFRHDNGRSGVADEPLDAATLTLAWKYESPQPPNPAWAGPAKWDAYAELKGMKSMRNYDPVFHPIVVGDRVYFGSTVDDSVHCLSTRDGSLEWTFTTDGPVRIAPTYYEGNLYFGSDDGHAYCVNAETGKLVWKFAPEEAEGTPRILNNGRLIPRWPCRTGILIDGGKAYCAMGLLPWENCYLCRLDAKTGVPEYVESHDSVTLEGAVAAGKDRLYIPQGRLPPLLFDKATGQQVGSLQNGGGCFVLVTPDGHVLHGPGNKVGWITDSSADTTEKLASFSGGNAMVVRGDRAFLLTDYSLSAIDRKTGKLLWAKPCHAPLELALAGETLFAGGDGLIAAFAAETGKKVWETAASPVEGKVFGLAVADGRLFAATTFGHLYCFTPSGERIAAEPKEGRSEAAAAGLVPIDPIQDKSLLGHWVFQRPHLDGFLARDLTGGKDGLVNGPVTVVRCGGYEAILLDDKTSQVAVYDRLAGAKLPKEQVSAEAWVNVRKAQEWGGLVGSIQDDGDKEWGWLLGFRGSKFCFALRGTEGTGRLDYMTAKGDFKPNRWHHVVGTYDGKEMRLYVDGELQAASTSQKGPIAYPEKGYFDIGVYRDDNEFYTTKGLLHEVCVYDRALSEPEIAARAKAKTLEMPVLPEPKERTERETNEPLVWGPYLRFIGKDALVRWQTASPMRSVVEWRREGSTDWRTFESDGHSTQHAVTATDLDPTTVYFYRLVFDREGNRAVSPEHQCDTLFNFSVPEFAGKGGDGEAAATAMGMLESLGMDKGVAVVLGIGDGGLVRELAGQSEMQVIAFDTDVERIDSLRKDLIAAGAYGTRVVAYRVDDLAKLPVVGRIANLVAARAADSEAARSEAFRLLRPGMGQAWIGETTGQGAFSAELLESVDAKELGGTTWLCLTKALPPGCGEWTHLYGRPDNSAFGGETLGGAVSTRDLEVQWVGRPGPRILADRNGRLPSPIAAGGRLFSQGLKRMVAIDPFNGTILWLLDVPGFLRSNVPRDCGNWCTDGDHVFAVLKNKCWKIDAATGDVAARFDVVPGAKANWKYDWGYIARYEDLLLGSSIKEGSSWETFWGGLGWFDAKAGPGTLKTCSEALFALDPAGGETKWTHHAEGVIINPTITVADGRVYFLEVRNPAIVAMNQRRLGGDEFWKKQYLVCIDAKTGEAVWERAIETEKGLQTVYLAAGEGKLILNLSDDKYHVYAFDAADGNRLWKSEFGWQTNDHGGHMQRPAIVSGKVFIRPAVLDLNTGKRLEREIPKGKCGTYAATSRLLIYRNLSDRGALLQVWDFETGEATDWFRLRPGCWLTTIPAFGLILSPEGGGGCSCGNWIETSVVFAPTSVDSIRTGTQQ